MTRRRALPLFAPPPAPKADTTLESARQRLGGAYAEPIGVVIGAAFWTERSLGIVVSATAEFVDLWVGAGRVKRARREELRAYAGPLLAPLSEVARDAEAFARLVEGTTVQFRSADGTLQEGLLLEKCRFGGLVARPDGRILALGFRRLGAPGRLWN